MELKKWRKAKSKELWLEDGIEREMPDTLLMSDTCLSGLAKAGESFNDKRQLVEFLQPWPDLEEFIDDIYACFQRSTSHGINIPTKNEKREVLKAARASKKAKFMDDPAIASAAKITAMRDQWLLKNNKMNPDLKAQMKKAKEVEQKQQAKLNKTHAKVQEQAQLHDIRRLTIGNIQIGTHKDVLSDPVTIPSSNLAEELNTFFPIIQTPARIQSIDSMFVANRRQQSKKKTLIGQRVNNLQRSSNIGGEPGTARTSIPRIHPQSLTPPPAQMELIKPGSKRRVKLTANAVENTSPKRMRAI